MLIYNDILILHDVLLWILITIKANYDEAF